jgi:predicted RNase H-like HicB family nuclease
MSAIRDIVEIKVDVTHDDDYGTVYVATDDDLGLVTDGLTFEALLDHLREALELCLQDAAQLNSARKPRAVITMRCHRLPTAQLHPHFDTDW